jgi:hypothetical protein
MVMPSVPPPPTFEIVTVLVFPDPEIPTVPVPAPTKETFPATRPMLAALVYVTMKLTEPPGQTVVGVGPLMETVTGALTVKVELVVAEVELTELPVTTASAAVLALLVPAPAGTVNPSVPVEGTLMPVKETVRVEPLPVLFTVAVAPPVAFVVVECAIVVAPM